jgi:aryl-alcohol dehydrogenase-like predicted oxidoreductase
MLLKPTSASTSTSAIGLGGATFGREIDEATAHALLDYALAQGITHFDTAAAYSAGVSESILGRWLASRRPARATVVTKLLPLFTAAEVNKKIDESLERLGRNVVDILYLHRWDASLRDDSLAALEEARRAGKCRALGMSNISPEKFSALLTRQRELGFATFEHLQCNQNYAVTDLVPAMLGLCAVFGLRVETFSPLGAGFLTGKHRTGVVPGSRFDLVPGHQAIYFNPAAQQRLQRILEVAASSGHAVERLALAWALRRPGVTTVLVGARHTGHIAQAISGREFNDVAALAALDQS